MINGELAIARKYVYDINQHLGQLLTERDQTARATHYAEIERLRLKIDQVSNPIIQGWRDRLNVLDRVTIDEFEGKCTVCHQLGHKKEECTEGQSGTMKTLEGSK